MHNKPGNNGVFSVILKLFYKLNSLKMKNESLAQKVYLELRRKILSNHLVAGVRLKEDYGANNLQVNRMAVREAINRLLGENLVIFGKKGGYFIKSLKPKDVKEIREVRWEVFLLKKHPTSNFL